MNHHLILAGPAAETTRLRAFWVLAILSVSAAIGMVLARKAVHCALFLAVVMLSLAVMYVMLGAPFLAFVQVIVYTGAVLMLFLFVLMIVGVAFAILLALVIAHATLGSAAPASARFGNSNLSHLANLIFTKYVFPL